MYSVEGLDMIPENTASGLVDGRHAESPGSRLRANGPEARLRCVSPPPRQRDALK